LLKDIKVKQKNKKNKGRTMIGK